MKLPVKPQGFFRTAGTRLTLRFAMTSTLLAAMFAGAIYSLWTSLYPKLDTVLSRVCTDTGAETGEAAYAPSKVVEQCTQGAQVASLMLISIATALLLCGAVTVLTLVVDGYTERGYKRAKQDVPVRLRNTTGAIRHNCGIVAFVMACCTIVVIVPRG